MRGIRKEFPGVLALDDVDLEAHAGEVLGLVGENGAGKSTLMRVLSGVYPSYGGEVVIRGQTQHFRSPRDAEAAGVAMIHQELSLVPAMRVMENIYLNREPRTKLGLVDFRQMAADARKLLEDLDTPIDVTQPVDAYSIGVQQMIEIAKALSRDARIVVMDEPTSTLSEHETERLFAIIERLKASGVAVIYISHKLDEIYRIADRITVLRDGEIIGTRDAADASLDEVIRMMVGRDLGEAQPRAQRTPGPVALRVEGLRRGNAVRDVSFQVRQGEILGFAGLMGSGRTETLRAVFGADHRDTGDIFLGGASVPARIRSPRDAVRRGMALTEDRKEQGLLLPLSVRINITLARLAEVARTGGWLRADRERDAARRLVDALGIRCRSTEQPAATLSGGNQQKVVLARWLFRDARVLLFDEPTRGIDVGAKFEIYRLLAELAERGKAIVVASSDLIELFAICDRIAVMSAGRLAATFRRGEWSQDAVMQAALSEYVAEARAS
jgi:ribose transport system ATP-binding protein